MTLLDTKEAAQRIRLSEKTLITWRSRGRGPKYLKVGGKVFYTEAHLDEFVAQSIVDPAIVLA